MLFLILAGRRRTDFWARELGLLQYHIYIVLPGVCVCIHEPTNILQVFKHGIDFNIRDPGNYLTILEYYGYSAVA